MAISCDFCKKETSKCHYEIKMSASCTEKIDGSSFFVHTSKHACISCYLRFLGLSRKQKEIIEENLEYCLVLENK